MHQIALFSQKNIKFISKEGHDLSQISSPQHGVYASSHIRPWTS